MEQIKIRLYKSVIGSTKRQKDTVKALGLGKVNSTAIHNSNPQILGMLRKVDHVVKIEKA